MASRPRSRAAEGRTASAPGGGGEDAFMFTPHPNESIDASYVFGRAVQLIVERPRQVIGVAVGSVVLSWLLLLLLTSLGALHNSMWQAAGIVDMMHPVGVLALMLLGWAAALLLQAPLVGSAIEVHTEGRGIYTQAFERARASLPRLLVASAVVTGLVLVVLTVAIAMMAGVASLATRIDWAFARVVFTGAGTLLITYLALTVIGGFSLIVPVTLVEDLEVPDAVRRSWALGKRNGWAIIWALMLPALLALGVMFPTAYMPSVIGLVLGAILGIALVLYNTVVIPVSYVAIREYVDGVHPGSLFTPARRRPR